MKARRSGPAVAGVLMAVSILGAACADDGSSGEATGSAGSGATAVEVVATDFSFDQEAITLAAGEEVEVTLTNDGSAPHTFTFEEADVVVEAAGGESGTASFTAPSEPGSFEFHCDVHPDQMKGTVEVE